MRDDEIRRRIEDARRAKERAGEIRHAPHVVAAALRRVAARPADDAPSRSCRSSVRRDAPRS